LLALMAETDSVDTFLTALEVLAASDPNCKGLLAAAVRHADRLNILKGRASGTTTPEQDVFDDALEQIMAARGHGKPAGSAGADAVPVPSGAPAPELLPMPTLTAAPVAGNAATSAVRCSEECCEGKARCPADGPRAGCGDAAVIADLVGIVRETKSRDAFVAAVMGLCRFEDNTPMPAVIRNADRLGLLDGLAEGVEPTPARQVIAFYLMGSDGPDGPADPVPSPLPPRTLPVIVGPLPAGPGATRNLPGRVTPPAPTVKLTPPPSGR
jgi:hypothetical protein